MHGFQRGFISQNLKTNLKKLLKAGVLIVADEDIGIGEVCVVKGVLPDTLLVKVMWALGNSKGGNEARRLISKDLIGEFL